MQSIRVKRTWQWAVLAILTLVLASQLPWSLSQFARIGLRAAGLEVSFTSLRGHWLTTLQVRGLAANLDALDIRVDTLSMRLHVPSLLGGQWRAQDLTLIGADVQLKTADSLGPTPPDGRLIWPAASESPNGGEAMPLDLRLDRVTIHRGQLTLPDSLAVLSSIFLEGRVESDRNLWLDTLQAELGWAGGLLPLKLIGRAHVSRNVLTVDTLRITGQETDLAAHGYVGRSIGADIHLQASPLMLREFAPWVPQTDEALTLDVHLAGPDSAMQLIAQGSFTDGGAMNAVVMFDPILGLVDIETLRVKDVNPSLIAESVPGRLSGDVRGQLRGTFVDSLSGMLEFLHVQGELNSLPLDAVQAHATLANGQATYNLKGNVASADVNLQGEWALTEGYGWLSGEFVGFDVGAYLDNQSSALNGSLRLELREELTAEAALTGGQLGRQSIAAGSIQARADPNTFDISGHLETDHGSIVLESARRDAILTGQIALGNLDLAGIANLEPASAINAQIALQGQWPPNSLTLEIAADSSLIDQLLVYSAHASASVIGTDLQLSFQASTDVGNAYGRGTMNLAGPLPDWTAHQIAFTGADIGAFGAPMSSDLAGELWLTGSGLEDVEGTVRLNYSTIGDQVIDSAQVVVSVDSGEASVSGLIYWPEGHLNLAATADSLAESPTVYLNQARFENVNLGAILSQPQWQTSLSGAVDTAFVRGGHALSGGVLVQLDRSSINDLALERGTLDLLADHGHMGARMYFDLPEGFAQIDTLLKQPGDSFALRGQVQDLDLHALADLEAVVSGSFDLAGSGSSLDSLIIDHADLTVSNTDINGIAVHKGRLFGSLRNERITLDTLAIESSVAHLTGAGQLAMDNGHGEVLELQGHLVDAKPLGQWLGPVAGGGAPGDTFRVNVKSHADSLQFVADFGLGPASWGEVRVLSSQGAARGYIIDYRPHWTDVNLELSRLSIPALAARHAALAIRRAEDQQLWYDAKVTIDDRRMASLQGNADVKQSRIVLQYLAMRLDDDHWQLDQPAVISTDDRYRVRNLLLVEDAQEVAIDGVLDFDGQQSLGLSLYNVQMRRFADLLGYEGLGGTVDGDFFLSGPSHSPVLDASVYMDVHHQNSSIGGLRVGLAYEDYRLSLDAHLSHEDGSSMNMSGHLPSDLRLDRTASMPDVDVDLAVEADRLNLQWLTPFLDPDAVTDLSGQLTADLDITGTAENPRMEGIADFSELNMHLPESGLKVRQGRIEAQSDGNTVRIDTIAARSGEGLLIGQGHAVLESLTDLQLDLSTRLGNFRLADTRPYQVDADGHLRLTGTLRRPELTGRLDLTGAVIRPQEAAQVEGSGQVAFTEADLQMLEQYFNIRVTNEDTTTYSLVDALSMDLEVGIPGNLWLRSGQNPEMDIALAGSLNMTKSAFEEQQLIGTLNVVPQLSTIHQFGRRFDIRSGRVTFTGPAQDPFFDLEAAMNIREQSTQEAQVTILLEAEGRLQDTNGIELALRSEPIDLDPADILLYIATGRPAADAFQTAGASTLEAGSNLAISQLNALISGAASEGLGLDVVRIQPEGGRGLTLTAGKHISRRLFTSVSWPLASEAWSDASRLQSRKALSIEYVLYPWLLARLHTDTSALGLSVLTQYTW